MLRHVAMFTWRDGTPDDAKAAVSEALSRLPAVIPSIRSYSFGHDCGMNNDNFDFVVTADFDDLEGFVTYRDHPEHQRLIAERIRPVVDQRAAAQFTFS